MEAKSGKKINHDLVTQNNLETSFQMIALWRAKKPMLQQANGPSEQKRSHKAKEKSD